eukprot:6493689-Karenia_brevis.AAC.1
MKLQSRAGVSHAIRFPEPDMDKRDPKLYEVSTLFEDKMLQRHPRKMSDGEFVFLSSRINTKDPQQVRGDLRSWIKNNARGALFNEPPSGYPRVINYLLRTVVVFAAAPKERHGNQIFSTPTK